MYLTYSIVELRLKFPFGTARGSFSSKKIAYIYFNLNNIQGFGEASPSVRYGESIEEVRLVCEEINQDKKFISLASFFDLEFFGKDSGSLEGSEKNRTFGDLLAHIHKILDDQVYWVPKFIRCGIDIAVLDWISKAKKIPLHQLLGLRSENSALTCYSVAIGNRDDLFSKLEQGSRFSLIKIKLGNEMDYELFRILKDYFQPQVQSQSQIQPQVQSQSQIQSQPFVPFQPLSSPCSPSRPRICVDVNEGWSLKEFALDRIQWLEEEGVDFIEQPMPASQIQDMRWIRARTSVPIFADESVQTLRDIDNAVDCFDGINLKLMKCGGVGSTLEMIRYAKSFGLKILIGCSIESSVSVFAAIHLLSLADYADLDSPFLISNNPFSEYSIQAGKIAIPTQPGIGV